MLKSITRGLIAIGAIAALIIPAVASARPVLPDRTPFSVSGSLPSVAAQAAPVQPARSFHWDDAGLGAAGMLAMVALGCGATVALRRRAILN